MYLKGSLLTLLYVRILIFICIVRFTSQINSSESESDLVLGPGQRSLTLEVKKNQVNLKIDGGFFIGC